MNQIPNSLLATLKHDHPETFDLLQHLALIIAISSHLGRDNTRDNAQSLFNQTLSALLADYTAIQ